MYDKQLFRSRLWLSFVAATAILMVGCAKSAHQTGQDVLDQIIPSDVLAQVDQSISFAELRASPNSYIGRTVLFGGIAMKTLRVKDRTEIEILQLPMMAKMPSDQRSQSEGRFLAVRSGEFLDPAVIEANTPLTIIGEVKGALTKPLDEGEYQYPVLEIKRFVNWKELQSQTRVAGYDRGYGGYGYSGSWPYSYGPYGYSGLGYYGSPYGPYGYGGVYPYFYGGRLSSPGPSPSPPSSVPPRFQKGR